jgi:hypothetical protein
VKLRAASLAALLSACGDPIDTGDVGEDLDERACAFVGVSGLTINAMTDMQADSLATIEPSDEPWTISLPESQPGWLRFEVTETSYLRLYVDQPDVAVDLYMEDASMGLPYPVAVPGCAEDIPEHFRLNLDQPGVSHLELAPTEGMDLWLMLMSPAVL